MSNLILVSLKDVKSIKPNKIKLEKPIKEEEDEENSYSDTDESVSGTSQNSCSIEPKAKRQRLTHLTPDEKMMRRKMKNRVAAQNARDRKKVKMDNLEELSQSLKDENERLKNENNLLKEKAKVLLEENRKLLKFKIEYENKLNAQRSNGTAAMGHLAATESSCVSVRNVVSTMNPLLEAEESAVFSNYVSQPKKQLQGMFQRILCVLILHTLNLINQQTSLVTHLSQRKKVCATSMQSEESNQVLISNLKVAKLRMTLAKLVKLLKVHRKTKPSVKQSQCIVPILKIYRASTMQGLQKTANACSLIMIMSLMLKSMKKSRIFFAN